MANMLLPGDLAPRFRAPALDGRPDYVFDSAAGRAIVMLFLGSGGWAPCAGALALAHAHRDRFDDQRACFFGVTIDRHDVAEGRVAQLLPGVRWFLDYDCAVSRIYGAAQGAPNAGYEPHWLLLDARMRVVQRAPIDRGEAIFAALDDLIAEGTDAVPAPVLVVPRVLDAATCRALIDAHNADGGMESGFMREEAGMTVMKVDHSFKRRTDHYLREGRLLDEVKARLRRFLLPSIAQAFQFEVTRVERWLVACYDDRDGGGFFGPHRDNSTRGTAHRKFACTINLNAEDYEGGDLSFPEFGTRTYRAPTGGAAVFSCSLLHTALPVTRGARYALLPFFYDDAGARLREQNVDFVTGDLKHYRSGLLN